MLGHFFLIPTCTHEKKTTISENSTLYFLVIEYTFQNFDSVDIYLYVQKLKPYFGEFLVVTVAGWKHMNGCELLPDGSTETREGAKRGHIFFPGHGPSPLSIHLDVAQTPFIAPTRVLPSSCLKADPRTPVPLATI